MVPALRYELRFRITSSTFELSTEQEDVDAGVGMSLDPLAGIMTAVERSSARLRLLTDPWRHTVKALFIKDIAASAIGAVRIGVTPKGCAVAANQWLDTLYRCDNTLHL